jgi:hypothetical protein
MPPVMPAAKLSPTGPRMTAVPPVMYSQPFEPQPSTTTDGAGVAHREALARLAGGEQPAGRRAVEDGVADDGVAVGDQRDWRARAGRRWCRPTGPCRHSRWRRRSTSSFRPCTAKAPSDWPAEPRSRTVTWPGLRPAMPKRRVICELSLVPIARWVFRIVVLQLHLLAVLEEPRGVGDHLRVERLRHLVAALQRAVARIVAGVGLGQQRVEVEVVEMRPRRG